MMKMYDTYIRINIHVPQLVHELQLDTDGNADYNGMAFKTRIVNIARHHGAQFGRDEYNQSVQDIERYYDRVEADLNSFRMKILTACKNVSRLKGCFN